jgi:hypothetical protein
LGGWRPDTAADIEDHGASTTPHRCFAPHAICPEPVNGPLLQASSGVDAEGNTGTGAGYRTDFDSVPFRVDASLNEEASKARSRTGRGPNPKAFDYLNVTALCAKVRPQYQ